MDPILEQHFKEDLEFQKRFNRHMEVYAENGKELARLGNLLEAHINDTKEMVSFFKGMNFTKKLLMWLLGAFAGVGTTILMIREIWK